MCDCTAFGNSATTRNKPRNKQTNMKLTRIVHVNLLFLLCYSIQFEFQTITVPYWSISNWFCELAQIFSDRWSVALAAAHTIYSYSKRSMEWSKCDRSAIIFILHNMICSTVMDMNSLSSKTYFSNKNHWLFGIFSCMDRFAISFVKLKFENERKKK